MKRRYLLCLLAAFTILAAIPGCSKEPAAETTVTEKEDIASMEELFFNPVDVTEMLGDPWVYWHEGFYYYTTSDGNTLTITKTDSLTDIQRNIMDAETVYIGAQDGLTELWAPEIYFYEGYWYSYIAADTNFDNTQHRMYVLKSRTDNALGEWDMIGKLELPGDQWAIDGTLFVHPDGRLYTIWSGWRNESEGTSQWKQYLYIAQLADRDPTTVISEERVMISEPQLLWENGDLPQNEGPAIVVSPEGTVYLVYSANFSGKNNYALGYLKLEGSDPMKAESWVKTPEPLLETSNELLTYSPGHCSFTKSPDGTEDWILYHAAKAYSSGWDRNARLQRLEWVDDRPYVELASMNEALPLPSGESLDRSFYEIEDGALDGGTIKEMDGASSGRLVTDGGVTVTVAVDTDGWYDLLLRHTNSLESNDTIMARVNDTDLLYLFAGRTGSEVIVGSTHMRCPLTAGENTIEFMAPEGVDLDLLILHNQPVR